MSDLGDWELIIRLVWNRKGPLSSGGKDETLISSETSESSQTLVSCTDVGGYSCFVNITNICTRKNARVRWVLLCV